MGNSIQNIWNYISNLGIKDDESFIKKKHYILANQVNFLLLISLSFMAVFMFFYRRIFDVPFNMGDVRINMVIIAALINFLFSYRGKLVLLRNSLLFFIPFILIVFPTLTGFVESESFFYYPSILIILSASSQVLIDNKREKRLYSWALVYYLILLLSIDYLLINNCGPELEQIVYFYKKDIWITKTVFIILFFFLHFSITYIKNLNYKYEKEILDINKKLKDKNAILDIQNAELKKVNRDLKNTQQQLVYSEKMASLGVLTAGIAHEINNPLNFISGGSFIISDFLNDIKNGQELDDEMLAYAVQGSEMISKGIDQAASVVSSLMTFSYSGKPKKKPEDLNKIIESTLLFQKQRIPLTLKFEKIFNLDRNVEMYAEKMHQIILNLVDNALFEIAESDMPEKDKFLKIETGINDDGMVFVKIANSGRNIKEDISGKLFDPFFTTKEPGKGTGLGLSIVNNLIQEHNGKVTFKNLENGVEFMITFPAGGEDKEES